MAQQLITEEPNMDAKDTVEFELDFDINLPDSGYSTLDVHSSAELQDLVDMFAREADGVLSQQPTFMPSASHQEAGFLIPEVVSHESIDQITHSPYPSAGNYFLTFAEHGPSISKPILTSSTNLTSSGSINTSISPSSTLR